MTWRHPNYERANRLLDYCWLALNPLLIAVLAYVAIKGIR